MLKADKGSDGSGEPGLNPGSAAHPLCKIRHNLSYGRFIYKMGATILTLWEGCED